MILTGERSLVFVLADDGLLNPREIQLGPVAGDFVQVLSGLDEGETIVTSANFLLDAESRIGGDMGGMPGMQMEPENDEGGSGGGR